MNYDPRSWKVHARLFPHVRRSRPADRQRQRDRPDPARYYDPAFARDEWDKVFTKTWLLAGPASDVREPGDWMKFDIGVESFIIVRADDGTLKAHYNVCPHRGSRLVADDRGLAIQLHLPVPQLALRSGRQQRRGHRSLRRSAPKCCATILDLTSVRSR